jgi:hypothetical protein
MRQGIWSGHTMAAAPHCEVWLQSITHVPFTQPPVQTEGQLPAEMGSAAQTPLGMQRWPKATYVASQAQKASLPTATQLPWPEHVTPGQGSGIGAQSKPSGSYPESHLQDGAPPTTTHVPCPPHPTP